MVNIVRVLGHHLGALAKHLFWNAAFTDDPKCTRCKGPMQMEKENLYVLPVSFGETHKECAEYYLNNAARIGTLQDIPTGRRACFIRVFRCATCGYRDVTVIDFLKVREEMVPKSAGCYEYEQFRGFLQ